MATSQNATKPDEDDLDDLDDVLEDFKQASLPATPARAASPPPLPPASALPPPEQDDQLDDDFLRDLQKEMEAILGPLPTQVEGMEGDEETKAMQAMFQRLMQEAADAGPPPGMTEGAGGVGEAKGKERSTGPSAAAPPAAGVGDEDFQETIRRTMAKMKESGEGVKVRDALDSAPAPAS